MKSGLLNELVRMVAGPVLAVGLLVGLCDAQPGPSTGGGAAEPEVRRVPAEVLDGAEAATRILGEQVMKGNFSFSIQRMYPRWRKRAALREGGDDKLTRKLMKVPEVMREQGISLLSFEVGEARSGHEVFKLRGRDERTGEEVEGFLEWLVFVPTRKVYRVIDPQSGKPTRIEMKGYQVAIVKKGTNEWYFVDGSTLTVSELRGFFPNLPNDPKLLDLPPVGGGELKN